MRCAFVTFGCRLNQYDTQAIREAVLDLGYEEVSARDAADLFVVNSCTVTARAGEKGVAAVRRLARRHPDARILVTGCLTSDDRRELGGIPGVETVIGNEEKDQIPALIQGAELAPVRGRRSRSIFNLRASGLSGHARAFLKVHDGCDDFCTYCVIPFLRGKSKSRPSEEIVAEAARMAEAGYSEVVITGIHLRQYGRDLPGRPTLGSLLERLRALDGVERVRLSSIGVKAFTPEFLALFRSDPGLCPFFHIPLQSGSASVLRRMRREYAPEEYLDALSRIRAALPRAVIATDLMVGFPQETEEEFERSLDVCRQAAFAQMHIFPYSPRPGTKAAALSGHVSAAVQAERLETARDLEKTLRRREYHRWIGREVRVLVERHRGGTASGLSREGIPVTFAAQGEHLRRRELPVLVEEAGSRGVSGRRLG